MTAVSISAGWKLFAHALTTSRFGSVTVAAEWMYRLNVFARSTGRHSIVDQVYELKNEFIKYLYQRGYCTEVKLHKQKRECHACGGTGEYWTGEDCWKCDGTGVFAWTRLYAFRFDINGHRYAWHQLEKLIDYPVTLSDAEPTPFPDDLKRDQAILSLAEAWLGCCVVWWCLFLHGRRTNLLLFTVARFRTVSVFQTLRHRLMSRDDDIPF